MSASADSGRKTPAATLVGLAVVGLVAGYAWLAASAPEHTRIRLAHGFGHPHHQDFRDRPWPQARPVIGRLSPPPFTARTITASLEDWKQHTDYGQILFTALHGGTPQQAMMAVNLLDECAKAPQVRDQLDRNRGLGTVSADSINAAEDTLRRCQSVTGDMQQSRVALLERAMLSGLKGTSVPYGEAVKFTASSDTLRAALKQSLVADAAEGNYAAVTSLATNAASVGLTSVEANAYLQLAQTSDNQYQSQLQDMSADARRYTDLPVEQQNEANAMVRTMRRTMGPTPGEFHQAPGN